MDEINGEIYRAVFRESFIEAQQDSCQVAGCRAGPTTAADLGQRTNDAARRWHVSCE